MGRAVRVAPQDGTAGYLVVTDDLRRFFCATRAAFRRHAQTRFALTSFTRGAADRSTRAP
jgi:hypothetical protein